MTAAEMERSFRDKVCAQISLVPEGIERYRVHTPFQLDDGDHLAIVLKRNGSGWLLSDEGNTFMHLSYDLDVADLDSGPRQRIVASALGNFGASDRDGEIVVPVEADRFGDALYSMVQALLRISDVTYLNREVVRSTFLADFQKLIEEAVPARRRVFQWHDAARDPQGSYAVDCRVNDMPRPLMIFALAGDDRARDATITLQRFEKWGLPHQSLGIFEAQEEIGRKVLARLTDVCERQYSSLTGDNPERIARFLRETIGAEA